MPAEHRIVLIHRPWMKPTSRERGAMTHRHDPASDVA
jgi:hypothetical protein